MELNWTKGKNLGLGMIIFSLSLFYQVILITIAVYAFSIGSLIIMTMIPLGATIAIAYSVSIIFTGNLTGDAYSKLQLGLTEKENFMRLLVPYLIVIGCFSVVFFLTYFVAVEAESVTPLSAFVIGENLAAIITLLVADRLRYEAEKRK